MIVFGLEYQQAILAGSLVIVTGPTVIAPLLKRIKVEERINSILHWEAVLIDPLGVFLVILCFEAFVGEGGQAAVINFMVRVGVGLPLGAAGGLLLSWIVKRNWVEEDMLNVFAFGSAVAVFALAEMVRPEMGLLSVTVAGFVFGLSGTAQLKQVRQFKAQITDLLIGTLFILLAARLEPAQFVDGFGLKGVLVVVFLMLVVRPLSIFICSWGGDLTTRQKVFLSWAAPRGIVAASLASLIAIRLDELGTVESPRFVETFTYSVIIATIVLQGSTAGWLAKMLGLKRKEPKGWMIVGAHTLGRRIAQFLVKQAGLPVVIVDTNKRRINEAKQDGLTALARDARDTALAEFPVFQGIGNILALTDNEDLNLRLCHNWADVLGRDHVFRYDPSASRAGTDAESPDTAAGRIVWGRLPRPSLLGSEIKRGETRLVVSTAEAPINVSAAMPLLVYVDGRVQLDPGVAAEELVKKEGAVMLSLRRDSDYLLRSMRPELFLTSSATDLQGLFEAMIDPVVELNPKLPRQEMIHELVERERAFPTALGHGIATPHAYCAALDERLCAIARVPNGLAYGARDGEPVRLVFLLLSPQGDPEGHLATLAEIARLMIEPRVRERALACADVTEMMELLRSSQSER